MARVVYQDVTSKDFEIVNIVIPANTGDGSSVDALKTVQSYDKRIASWEIVENAAAFEVAKEKEMALGKITPDADAGFAPPVGRFALPTTFLRSTTAATVAAVLILYTAEQETDDKI